MLINIIDLLFQIKWINEDIQNILDFFKINYHNSPNGMNIVIKNTK